MFLNRFKKKEINKKNVVIVYFNEVRVGKDVIGGNMPLLIEDSKYRFIKIYRIMKTMKQMNSLLEVNMKINPFQYNNYNSSQFNFNPINYIEDRIESFLPKYNNAKIHKSTDIKDEFITNPIMNLLIGTVGIDRFFMLTEKTTVFKLIYKYSRNYRYIYSIYGLFNYVTKDIGFELLWKDQFYNFIIQLFTVRTSNNGINTLNSRLFNETISRDNIRYYLKNTYGIISEYNADRILNMPNEEIIDYLYSLYEVKKLINENNINAESIKL